MKISEVIAKLAELQAAHGDLHVIHYDDEYGDYLVASVEYRPPTIWDELSEIPECVVVHPGLGEWPEDYLIPKKS